MRRLRELASFFLSKVIGLNLEKGTPSNSSTPSPIQTNAFCDYSFKAGWWCSRSKGHDGPCALYKLPDGYSRFPHCDSRVLHAPGFCEYCDRYSDWQNLRRMWKINFTGQTIPGNIPCPSETRRPLDVINRWQGNRPNGI